MQRASSAVQISNLSASNPYQAYQDNPESQPSSRRPSIEAVARPTYGHARTISYDSGDSAEMAAAAATVGAMSGLSAGLHAHPAENHPDLPRPYKCPLCDKAFHRLEHQTRHIRTHTGEKPHACQFPGCTKRFSRSDELTRHSRIHNNPNSRRSNKAAAHNVAAMHSYAQDQSIPAQKSSRGPSTSSSRPTQSAPVSQVGSPNVSPPNSYSPYGSGPHLQHFAASRGGPPGALHQSQQQSHMPTSPTNPLDINLLATAASQVEREDSRTYQLHTSASSSAVARHPPRLHHTAVHPHHHHHPYHGIHTSSSANRLPALSQYAYSQNVAHPYGHSHPQSRSHSPSNNKRSRPGSPQFHHPPSTHSTAPSSPTFSHDSYSPTPDHTPLATPAHSPRLRPFNDNSGLHLPSLRHLSLTPHAPVLAPLEPVPHATDPTSYGTVSPVGYTSHGPPGNNSMLSAAAGPRLSDIMSRADGAARKLPTPQFQTQQQQQQKIAVHDMLNPVIGHGTVRVRDGGFTSGSSSGPNSITGDGMNERY